ncbi:response regulator [Candidatus Saccharibacteria bacterium]|nr:response regulator [Candidatus Saccharibacteria bacterium]
MTAQKTILLVDQDPSYRAVFASALSQHGYHVLTAADSRSALEQATNPELHIDSIVTDILLPGKNGLKLIQSLRLLPHHTHTPILIVTTLEASDVGLVANLREALGVIGYLVKQKCRPSDIVHAINHTTGT